MSTLFTPRCLFSSLVQARLKHDIEEDDDEADDDPGLSSSSGTSSLPPHLDDDCDSTPSVAEELAHAFRMQPPVSSSSGYSDGSVEGASPNDETRRLDEAADAQSRAKQVSRERTIETVASDNNTA